MLARHVIKKEHLALSVGMQNSTTLTEISMKISERTKIRISIQPSYLPAGCLPKEFKSSYYSDTCIPMFRAEQLVIAKCWK